MAESLRLILVTVSVPALLVALRQQAFGSRWSRLALGTGLVLLTGYLLRIEVHAALANLRHPREWDFLCFWLWGRAGANRLNFYDPAISESSARDLDLTSEFQRQIVEVGFWYPPPTMLLFAPFGALSLRIALGFWYLLQFSCLGLSAVLLHRVAGGNRFFWSVAILAALLLSLPAAHMTLWFAQTNFMVLAMLTLLWLERDRPRAGLWLAFGLLIKPYFIVLGAFLICRRNWKGLLVGSTAGLMISIVTLAIFGWLPIHTFVEGNPITRLPVEIHSEPINQSLYGTLLRLTHNQPLAHSVRANGWFWLSATVILASTAVLAWRSGSATPARAFSLILTAVLLLYPSTLAHYSLMLILPLLMLWRERQGRSSEVAIVALVTLVVGVTGFAHGTYAFWATAAVWLVFAVSAVLRPMPRGAVAPSAFMPVGEPAPPVPSSPVVSTTGSSPCLDRLGGPRAFR